MAELGPGLVAAAARGDLAAVAASLAAGADPSFQGVDGSSWWSPLHAAVYHGHPGCVQRLIQAGAWLDCPTPTGHTPLHQAAMFGRADCAALMLAAGAYPAAKTALRRSTPLHCATFHRHCAVLQQLLGAAPAAAGVRDADGRTPLELALSCRRMGPARCLLSATAGSAALPSLDELLALLSREGEWAQPLFATLAARQPLSPEQWQLVPDPCAGLGAALPPTLERSADEAALLVARLPAADRQRLHTAALCLARVQPELRLQLPTPCVWRMLALSAAVT